MTNVCYKKRDTFWTQTIDLSPFKVRNRFKTTDNVQNISYYVFILQFKYNNAPCDVTDAYKREYKGAL
jgi:hypothetical protein